MNAPAMQNRPLGGVHLQPMQRINRVRDGPNWITQYASIFEVTLYGFLVGATFLNRAHFDFLYHVVAMASALYPVALLEMSKAADARSGRRMGTGELVIRDANPYLARGAT